VLAVRIGRSKQAYFRIAEIRGSGPALPVIVLNHGEPASRHGLAEPGVRGD